MKHKDKIRLVVRRFNQNFFVKIKGHERKNFKLRKSLYVIKQSPHSCFANIYFTNVHMSISRIIGSGGWLLVYALIVLSLPQIL